MTENFFSDRKNIIILLLSMALAAVLFVSFRKSKEARDTDRRIMGIGEVTLTSGELIEQAREAYEDLSVTHKRQVEHLDVLVKAEQEYLVLCDQAEAEKVDQKIRALGEITSSSGEAIEEARAAYDALSETQKTYVTAYEDLLAAEKNYDEVCASQLEEQLKDITEALGEAGSQITEEMGKGIEELIRQYQSLTQEQIEAFKESDLMKKIQKIYESYKTGDLQEQIGQAVNSGEGMEEALHAYNSLEEEVRSGIERNPELKETINYYSKAAQRQYYISGCTAVSCEDLKKEPDKWIGKQIQLKLEILEVRTDRSSEEGDYLAKVEGTESEVILFDQRETGASKLNVNDQITVYGTAAGSVKRTDKNKANGTAEEILPAVNVVYTSADLQQNGETAAQPDAEYYYRKGEELAGRLNQYLKDLGRRINTEPSAGTEQD